MYMTLVSILRTFIRAGRTGNWLLYLQALQQMLPYLAAAGHHNYTKSLVLYLTQMEKLQDTHPHASSLMVSLSLEELKAIGQEYTATCTSNKSWWETFNAIGGLTRGRGFDQTTSLVWLLSTPACAEVNRAMRDVTDLQDTNTSDEEVHKDRSAARMARDAKDVQTILHYFSEPFSKDSKELPVCHLESWQTNL